MSEVVIIRTGAANTASVVAALERADCTIRFSESAEDIKKAQKLVLPGVGAFGPVSARLRERGLADALATRIQKELPTLAICLGLQLLAASSDEDTSAHGLGVLSETVTRFEPGLRAPQLGWNRVTANPDCLLLEDGEAYFANSFKLDSTPQGWAAAFSDHGGPFIAAIEKGAVLGCQFHPELSGDWGQNLLERWLAVAEEA